MALESRYFCENAAKSKAGDVLRRSSDNLTSLDRHSAQWNPMNPRSPRPRPAMCRALKASGSMGNAYWFGSGGRGLPPAPKPYGSSAIHPSRPPPLFPPRLPPRCSGGPRIWKPISYKLSFTTSSLRRFNSRSKARRYAGFKFPFASCSCKKRASFSLSGSHSGYNLPKIAKLPFPALCIN